MLSVKKVAESCVSSSKLERIPSKYMYLKNKSDEDSSVILCDEEAQNITIPTIDFSHLISSNPTQRSKEIQQLGRACTDWGFFMLINHGVPETLREEVLRACKGFYDLPEEYKRQYEGGDIFAPIKCGTSFNANVEKTFLWRDYLKCHVHPHFHAPSNPQGFSETTEAYCKRSREVIGELLKGISISLGQEENYIHKVMNIESGFQMMVVNFYPRCPMPDQAMGLPPHSDHGLLTLLLQNELEGLQLLRNDMWIPIHPLPNSFIVNTGDHMEILTNGKYKSNIHRAIVNKNATRITIGTAHGPPLDAVVGPATELIGEDNPPAYRAIKYKDYMRLQQSKELDGKSCLGHVRISI
ncbi:2-oxoglutarate-dependent dioxygenase 19 [Arachis duranensis]|uniref:2-oxoglutarate-dependent dioxygenase 19 n=1 Tax=Arachis duranensis TaxID=130453 RepID=A0A6P4BXS5_ARADU|nr:2-oxoglutarate-dependent dioxygenase 19 [Arachis duranensis]